MSKRPSKVPGLADISVYGGLPSRLAYGMDHTPTYAKEEHARLYDHATSALLDRLARFDGLQVMAILGALELITALEEPPRKVSVSTLEAAQALVLRSTDAQEVLLPNDANAMIDDLQIHLDLFLDQTAKPRRGAKQDVLARRVMQTLRMRHTSYGHHAKRIHDAIRAELEAVGIEKLGLSLARASKLAQAAGYGVSRQLADSSIPIAIGDWLRSDQDPFDPEWVAAFEIDMDVLAAVAGDVPRTALDLLFDRLSIGPGDLFDANPDHLHLDNPIWRKPFVKKGDRIFCFSPQTLFSAHDDMLTELAASVWPQPAESLGHARGAALERLLAETLAELLPDARVLTACKWTDPRDGRAYETDAIVILDGMALIWEAKGSALSKVARRGSNEWFKTFDDIVVEACIQATRLEELLRDAAQPNLELTNDQGSYNLVKSSVRHVARFGISLERVTMASFGLEDPLRERIERASALPMPIITIGDLLLLAELVPTEGARLHYLLRRSEIEEDTLFVGDELDLIAWYLRSGFVGLDGRPATGESIMLYGLSELLRFLMKKTAYYDPRHAMPRRTSAWWEELIADKETRRPALWTDVVYDLLNVPLLSQERFLEDTLKLRRKVRRLKGGAAGEAALMQRRDQRHPAIFASAVTRRMSDQQKIGYGRSLFAQLCRDHPDERVVVFHLEANDQRMRPKLTYYRGTSWSDRGVAVPIEGEEMGSDLYFSVEAGSSVEDSEPSTDGDVAAGVSPCTGASR